VGEHGQCEQGKFICTCCVSLWSLKNSAACTTSLGQSIINSIRPCKCSVMKMVAVYSSENTYPFVKYPLHIQEGSNH